MKYKLNFSIEAEKDLNDLFEYILTELEAPQAANNFMASVEKKVANLKEQPFMYPQCTETPLYELGYRKLIVKNHVIIYAVDDKANIVNIIRIFYGRQDYTKYF